MSDRSRSSSPVSQKSMSSRSRSGSRSGSASRSRSRSFSSSSSSPRFVSATDSETEKKSGNESPRRKVKTKKSPKHSQDDSDSEADEEPKARKQRPARGAATAAKGRKGGRKKESEEGEISSNDSNKEEFDDGLDEDLIGDDADRARLEKMTEREREEELFKRAENREQLKKRFEIQKKLKQQQKLKAKDLPLPKDAHADSEAFDEIDYNNVMDTKERSQTRQKKIEEKKFDQKSSALSELKAKRQEKERKEAERQKKEYDKDNDDGDHKSRHDKRKRSSSSSSSASGGSERSRRSSTSSQSSSGSGSDTERFKKSPSKVQKYIESQEDLEPIRLSRFKLEKFVHLPCFKRLVMNCFVRIGIGQHQGRSVYRAAEIVDVVETGKVYLIGKARTNIGVKLKFGKQERVFRLEFVSNQRISPAEFIKWKEACEEANVIMPTTEFVKTKGHEIKKAMNFEFTSDDIDKIVAQKEKFSRHPVNYAMHKARLIKEKEIAIANGMEERARELEEQLMQHEERAEELDKKRTSTISSVSLINDRNRKANVSKAEAAIRLEMRRKLEEGVQSNPFTRRKCNPRMVTKTPTNVPLISPLALNPDQKENVVKMADTSLPAVKRQQDDLAPDDGGAETGGISKQVKKKPKFGAGLPKAMQKEDLFDAHNFDIEINVDTSATNSSTSVPPSSAPVAASGINIKSKDSGSASGAMPKRSLNLDDYKKKRGLI